MNTNYLSIVSEDINLEPELHDTLNYISLEKNIGSNNLMKIYTQRNHFT